MPVTIQPFQPAIDRLTGWAKENGQRRYVSLCTTYTVTRARQDPRAWQALQNADLVAPDGVPLVWVQRRRGHQEAQRVYGPDVLLAMCAATSGRNIRHFFFGGLPGVADQLAAKLQTQFPDLQIVGTYSPPVAEVEDEPSQAVIDLLNQAEPDIVWVGVGSPKQDVWMSIYRPELEAPLLIGVGAAFDFVSGTKRQAPKWMRRRGLEWLFRLSQEPRRLWRRYLIYNTLFLWHIIREEWGRRSRRPE